MFDIGVIQDNWQIIAFGLWNTLWICFFGCLLAIALGLVLAIAQMKFARVLYYLIAGYVEICRGVPLLILLFLLYYGGPSIGIRLDAATAGLIGIGAYGAGYFSELFRGGFSAIPQGQLEAARMLRIPSRHVLTQIQLPQMRKLIAAPTTNQIIILVKESALLSVISVDDLTKSATTVVNQTFSATEPYIAAALLYWLIIEVISFGGSRLERRSLKTSTSR